MSGMGYLATGFGAIWLLLACYLFWLGRRQHALQRRLEELELHTGSLEDGVHRPPSV
jgi:CcmD family protein